MREVIVVAALACACSLDESGQLDAAPPADAASLDVSPETAPSEAAADGPAEDAVTADAACDPSACPGERCTNGACDFYATCAEMHAADPARATGLHSFHNATTAYTAWCDMDEEGGGWTLVGRSASGKGSTTFGWGADSQSDPTDLTTPYSLDPIDKGLTFTEALAGTRTGTGLAWGAEVYRVTLPAGFPSGLPNSSATTTVTTVAGTCTTAPSMLGRVGYTKETTFFFFRDIDMDDAYKTGLQPASWYTYWGDCRGGLMIYADGMLMAR